MMIRKKKRNKMKYVVENVKRKQMQSKKKTKIKYNDRKMKQKQICR